MDLLEVIKDVRQNCCSKCKAGMAIAALEQVASTNVGPWNEFTPAAQSENTSRRGGHPKPEKTRSKPTKPHQSRIERTGAGEKTCNGCGKPKPISEYPKSKTCADGHAGTCKVCIAKKHREYYAKRHGNPTPDPPVVEEMEDDEDDDSLPCPLCRAKCSSEGRLQSHMRTVHGKAM